MGNENDEPNSAEVDAAIDAAAVFVGGSITTSGGMTIGALIDPALWTSSPRYRIHLGQTNVWPLAQETTHDQALAMAKGLRDNGSRNVRLIEITETATEIQLDEETSA